MVLIGTRNASLRSGSTSVITEVVGQKSKLWRLRLSVRVPGRSGPSSFITLHCGLHCGIRLRSETRLQTVLTGALISTSACNSGAAMVLLRLLVGV